MKKILLIIILLLLTSCASFKLVKPITTKVHGIELTPSSSWNKANFNRHKKSEVWTKDGLGLNELYIIGNLNDGETIFKSTNKELPLPGFKKNMLPNEIEEFLKTSFKNNYNGKITVNTESMEPKMIQDTMGFRVKLSYYLEGGLAKKVDALVSIKDDKLYLVMFIAPKLHYSERYSSEVNSIFESVRL
tara:strand:- start:751 stop:1317 length:567 start_codon:yes stop_codon:yes gene_type:complete